MKNPQQDTAITALSHALTIRMGEPVSLTYEALEDEIVIAIGDKTHPLPLPITTITTVDPAALAYDIHTFIVANDTSDKIDPILLPFYESCAWSLPGIINKKAFESNGKTFTDEHAALNKATYALDRLLNSVIKTGVKSPILLPKSLHAIQQMTFQLQWQRQAEDEKSHGYYEIPDTPYYQGATQWDDEKQTVSWQLGTPINDMILPQSIKDQITSEIANIKQRRNELGLPALNNGDWLFSTVNEFPMQQFMDLHPMITQLHYEKLHPIAQRLYEAHQQLSPQLSHAQAAELLYTQWHDAHTIKKTAFMPFAAQFLKQSPLSENDQQPWRTLSTEDQYVYLDTCKQLLQPQVVKSIEHQLAQGYEQPSLLMTPDQEREYCLKTGIKP